MIAARPGRGIGLKREDARLPEGAMRLPGPHQGAVADALFGSVRSGGEVAQGRPHHSPALPA